MPEGFTMPGGGTAAPVYDDVKQKPPPDQHGPRGYTWNRQSRSWQAKVKGEILYKPDADAQAQDEPRAAAPAADLPQGDPDPGWFADNTDQPQAADGKKRPFRIEDVPREVQEQLAGALGFMGMAILPVVEAVDPYCGRAFSDNFQRIAQACVPLMCRSERVIKFMTASGGGFMDYVALGMALAPVGKAIAEHHIFRTVEVVRDASTGQVSVLPRRPGPEHGDHLTPPQQPAYAA